MSRPQIAIMGVFGAGNFGNEATLAAYLRFIRAKHTDPIITCICYNTELVKATYNIAAVAIGSGPTSTRTVTFWQKFRHRLACTEPVRWLHTLILIRKYDALVIPGTGILDDYGTSPGGLPLLLFRWCLAARLCRVPTSFIGIGAGPINHPVSRRLMSWAAKLARFRSYRDLYSKNYARSIGVETSRDTIIPDLAFLHADVSFSRIVTPGSLHVGLGLMTYLGWSCREDEGGQTFSSYIEKMTSLARWLLDQGHHLHLLIGELSDQRAVNTLLDILRRELSPEAFNRIAAVPQSSMEGVLAQAETIDIAIVSRFHNLVAAFCRGKPALSIGYSVKNDFLMADFGLAAFTQKIDTLDLDRLFEQFNTLLSQRSELSVKIGTHAVAHRNALQQHLSRQLNHSNNESFCTTLRD